jgi:DNA-binding winged helix-turn-helix (wHTH) protein
VSGVRILPVTPGDLSVRFRFLDFVLDAGARTLEQGDQLVHLTPKALDLLVLLASERPKVVVKAVILERVWPDTFVTDASIARTVHEIRDALGDHDGRAVRTVHGHGYAFAAEIVELDTRAAPDPQPQAPTRGWLVTGGHAFRLTDGELVIGRDPAAAIAVGCLQASWRHARLHVDGGRATIEDLGSKNGTRLRGELVTCPTALRDGDVLEIGTGRLTFHVGELHPETSTKDATR